MCPGRCTRERAAVPTTRLAKCRAVCGGVNLALSIASGLVFRSRSMRPLNELCFRLQKKLPCTSPKRPCEPQNQCQGPRSAYLELIFGECARARGPFGASGRYRPSSPLISLDTGMSSAYASRAILCRPIFLSPLSTELT